MLLRHTQLYPIILSQGYSQIKIDHIVDSLLKLQIKIGVHLINVELSQLLTLEGTDDFEKVQNTLFSLKAREESVQEKIVQAEDTLEKASSEMSGIKYNLDNQVRENILLGKKKGTKLAFIYK